MCEMDYVTFDMMGVTVGERCDSYDAMGRLCKYMGLQDCWSQKMMINLESRRKFRLAAV